MKEQRGFGTHTYAGTSSELHPEDVPSQTDDWIYEQKSRSSTRRYGTTIQQATPRTIMRYTHHKGLPPPPIQRASRGKQPQTEEPSPIPVRQQRHVQKQRHWLVYVGGCLFVMLIGWILFGALANVVQTKLDDLAYGYPRTSHHEEDVGHGGVSYFTVVNLHGHILTTEILVDHPDKAKIYIGPVLSGPGADLPPGTVAFPDVNNDGYPDMVLTVAGTQHVYLGSKDGFQAPTSG